MIDEEPEEEEEDPPGHRRVHDEEEDEEHVEDDDDKVSASIDPEERQETNHANAESDRPSVGNHTRVSYPQGAATISGKKYNDDIVN